MFEFRQQNVAVGERRTKGSFAVLVETCKINKWGGLATGSESGDDCFENRPFGEVTSCATLVKVDALAFVFWRTGSLSWAGGQAELRSLALFV